MLDLKIYVDIDPDLRLARRLQRDIAERGRTVESVINQCFATVGPMHLQFVEPSNATPTSSFPKATTRGRWPPWRRWFVPGSGEAGLGRSPIGPRVSCG